MPSAINLVALDIDGTLLPTFHARLTPRVKKVLRDALQALEVTFLTGRCYSEVQQLLEDLGHPKVWLGLGSCYPDTLFISGIISGVCFPQLALE